ncbi:MAG: histidine kinase [Pseudomonadota bacterium]
MQVNTPKSTQSNPLLLLGFWVIVFLVNLGPVWNSYSSVREGLEVAGLATALQWLVSVLAIRYLVPYFLDRDRLVGFVFAMIALVFAAAEINVLVSVFYLEPAYPETYGAYYLEKLSHLSLIERMGFSITIRWIVLGKLPTLCFPAAILIAVDFYQKQKKLLELREQKQAAELNALKSQLNPHFIFNTLNNIYSLALSRSERTAEAVERLSGILDYVLHHCHETYVSLSNEVQMINDYIALEALRFGDRVDVTFVNEVREPARVAPLLFLSLVENAFKHGASEALGDARVDIHLVSDADQVMFEISNTKPATQASNKSVPSIGIRNLQRQLELLYPDAHELVLSETQESYTAKLTIRDQRQTDA